MPLFDLETSADSPIAAWCRITRTGSVPRAMSSTTPRQTKTPAPCRPPPSGKACCRATVYGMGLGAVLVWPLATQGEVALYGMYTEPGCSPSWAGLFGSRYGLLLGAVNRVKGGPLLGGILGAAGGAIVGSAAAVLLVGYLGTIPGSIVANLLGRLAVRLGWKPFGEVIWTLVALAGGMSWPCLPIPTRP